jgi:hypothetical protein
MLPSSSDYLQLPEGGRFAPEGGRFADSESGLIAYDSERNEFRMTSKEISVV